MFVFNHSNSVVKQNFSKRDERSLTLFWRQSGILLQWTGEGKKAPSPSLTIWCLITMKLFREYMPRNLKQKIIDVIGIV